MDWPALADVMGLKMDAEFRASMDDANCVHFCSECPAFIKPLFTTTPSACAAEMDAACAKCAQMLKTGAHCIHVSGNGTLTQYVWRPPRVGAVGAVRYGIILAPQIMDKYFAIKKELTVLVKTKTDSTMSVTVGRFRQGVPENVIITVFQDQVAVIKDLIACSRASLRSVDPSVPIHVLEWPWTADGLILEPRPVPEIKHRCCVIQ